jgi:hypothetical protein
MKKKIDVGGVPVTPEEIREAREKLANTGGTAIKQVLAAIDNPLASCDYWGEINRALAADPTLVVPPQTKSDPAQHAKIVFDIVLARKEAEALGLPQDETKQETAKIESLGKGPGHDLITGRRTAKKNYGENMAAEWGWTIPGVVDVEKVGDKVPKLGYDVKVTLADGTQMHIEAKATGGNGDLVAIEEGERMHNQDSGCKDEEVLFVISDVQSTMIDGEWRCWGGTKVIIRSWKIDSSDLTLQPSWLYKVPQPHAGHDGPPLGSVSPGEE